MSRLVADLPGAIHLIAKAPQLHVERLGVAVALAQVAPVAAGRAVDVLDKVARFVEAARAEVDRQHRLSVGLAAPIDEFMHADGVRIGGVPGEVETSGALFARADAVFPVVGGDKVAAGIADDGNFDVLDELQHVLAHALFVCGLMVRLVNAGVDRAPEMLEKRAIDSIVDVRDRIVGMRDDLGFHDFPPLIP